MPEFDQASLLEFFSQYAYQPHYVYGFIVLFMLASSFGFPVPEEIVLVSSGLVGYLASNPDKFPPPYPGATPVNLYLLMIVSFLAVLGSDFLVYSLGRIFGDKLIKTKFMQKHKDGKTFTIIDNWFKKYGGWAAGVFRFTPGLRFPGHLTCGMMKYPVWKFLLIDSVVALLSVPTQVYIVAKNGEHILEFLREFKMIVFGVLFAVAIIYFIRLKLVKPKKESI